MLRLLASLFLLATTATAMVQDKTNFSQKFNDLTLHKAYVDKTNFINAVEASAYSAQMILRPPGFFKTSMLHMLAAFYGDPNARVHFQNKNIARHRETMKHQGKHPIIFIDFTDFNASTKDEAFAQIKRKIINLYQEKSADIYNQLSEYEQEDYAKILNGTVDLNTQQMAVKNLIEYIYDTTQKKPVVLVDGVDVPFLFA
jgi:ABC-type phosphate/phosphonate transport system ATPase subunit